MKTVTLKFVIDDKDWYLFEPDIQRSFEGEDILTMGNFPFLGCSLKKATKKEIAWRKKYDKEN